MTEPTTEGILESRSALQEGLRSCFKRAADEGCREIFICDADFADWPLAERGVIEDLTRWSMAHRKLTVLARSFDDFPRRHVRWVEWRRNWTHVVDCRALPDVESGQIPGLFLAPGVATLRVLDPQRHRGSLSHDAADAIRARETVEALLQRSESAFPATMLGL